MDTNKQKALDEALTAIQKQFGKGAVMRLGEEHICDVEAISSGCLSLDIGMGVGGYPKGRIVEIYGPESSGKTTLTLHAIASVQKTGGTAAFIDVEHALDPSYAHNLGVKIEDLIVSQPDTGEEALEIAEMLIRSHAVDLVIIDSVAALVPRAEIQGDMGDSHVGLQARLMSQALRKIAGAVSKSGCVCIFINQLREKIGIMFGNPETTTGGRALKFYSSIRLDIRKIEAIKSGDSIIGNKTRVKVVKNKVAPPFKEVEVEIIYGEGISYEADIVDLAVQRNIISKASSWFTYGESRWQGKEAVKKALRENPELTAALAETIKNTSPCKSSVETKPA